MGLMEWLPCIGKTTLYYKLKPFLQVRGLILWFKTYSDRGLYLKVLHMYIYIFWWVPEMNMKQHPICDKLLGTSCYQESKYIQVRSSWLLPCKTLPHKIPSSHASAECAIQQCAWKHPKLARSTPRANQWSLCPFAVKYNDGFRNSRGERNIMISINHTYMYRQDSWFPPLSMNNLMSSFRLSPPAKNWLMISWDAFFWPFLLGWQSRRMACSAPFSDITRPVRPTIRIGRLSGLSWGCRSCQI